MREPTKAELSDLKGYLHLEAIHDLTYDEVEAYVSEATIGVFDGYVSETPGYAGKLMVVVWAYPEMYELYKWDEQKMLARVKQDKVFDDL